LREPGDLTGLWQSPAKKIRFESIHRSIKKNTMLRVKPALEFKCIQFRSAPDIAPTELEIGKI